MNGGRGSAAGASRRPRVAHFTVAPEMVDRIIVQDLTRLREREDVTVICAPGPAVDAVRARGIPVLTVPAHRKINPLGDLMSVWRLWRLLRAHGFDVLHTYAPKGGLIGQLAGAVARVRRRVHSCHGLLYTPEMPRWRRMLFRTTDRLTNRLADRTMYVSRADMELSVGEALCDARSARFVGSGIELAQFSHDALPPGTREEVRRRFGVGDDDVLVLTVGRFVYDKGYRELAAAAAELRDEWPNVRYVWAAPELAGEDGVPPGTLAADHGVADRVTRLAYMANVMELYAAADLLVHPSYREGSPRVLMEAAAMGVPILATDIPGCREVVRHGETALLFPPRDARAVADALRTALRDPAASRARAAAALRDVRQRFDQDAYARRIWDVHAEVLGAADVADAPR